MNLLDRVNGKPDTTMPRADVDTMHHDIKLIIMAFPQSPMISIKHLSRTIEASLKADKYDDVRDNLYQSNGLAWLLTILHDTAKIRIRKLIYILFYDIENTPTQSAQANHPLFMALVEHVFEQYLGEPDNYPYYSTGPNGGQQMRMNDKKVLQHINKYLSMKNVTPLTYLHIHPDTPLKGILLNTLSAP